MVFEAQGGVEPRCAAILHRIAMAVAAVEGSDVASTKSTMLQRIAVIIARSCASCVQRRAPLAVSSMVANPAVQLLAATSTLEQPLH